MSKMKIAIQGELGAYSHIAVEKLYKDADIKTCATFEDTFKQAYNEPRCKIVIPIENSLAGRVADIHYLLPKYKLLSFNRYLRKVVLPEPRNPETTITGIFFFIFND